MIADWVATVTRGRGLSRRRLGRVAARALAGLPSFDRAVIQLARTPYGQEIRVGMDAHAAEHAIFSVLLWHLRILAGWAPPQGAGRIRLLAAAFEIANIINHLARLNGREVPTPYILGSLAISWPRIEATQTPAELREALAVSAWGDPGSEELGVVRIALQAIWARRVVTAVPEARDWATAFSVLLIARAIASGAKISLDAPYARHIRAVVGATCAGSTSPAQLAESAPRVTAWLLRGIEEPQDLWRAEARWWMHIEADGAALCAKAQPAPGTVVGLVALLAADAWRTRVALEIAARGGDHAVETFDAIA